MVSLGEGDDQLVGVVACDNMYRGDKKGYGLVVTRMRLIGGVKPESVQPFQAFLPGSTEPLRADAARVAGTLLARKDFEVEIGSVGQVLVQRPGLFTGGSVIIKTGTESIKVETSVLYVEPGLAQASDVLRRALSVVLGWRLCDTRGRPITNLE